MRKYHIRIIDVDSRALTELHNVNLKTILSTIKSLSKNTVEKQYIKNTGKKVRIASDKFNKEVQEQIKNFN